MITQTLIPTAQQTDMHFFTILRRILIIGSRELLDRAVTRLLMIRADLEVIPADDSNLNDLALKAAQLHPDVIILCHTEPSLQDGLVALLDCIPSLADLRIIIVHPLNNKLDVYHRHHWVSADHVEFFPLVYGENPGTLKQLVYEAA